MYFALRAEPTAATRHKALSFLLFCPYTPPIRRLWLRSRALLDDIPACAVTLNPQGDTDVDHC